MIEEQKNRKNIPEGGLAAGDVVNQFTGERWYYSDTVKEHFFNPRNLMLEEPDESAYDATGMVGSPACLSATTLVRKNPSLVSINKIKIGECVLSHDSKFHPVERVFRVRYPSQKLMKIILVRSLRRKTTSYTANRYLPHRRFGITNTKFVYPHLGFMQAI